MMSKLDDIVSIKYSVPVTPSDVDDINPCRALLVATAGVVKVTYSQGTVDKVYLEAGIWQPMYVKRVWAANLTATDVHAGY